MQRFRRWLTLLGRTLMQRRRPTHPALAAANPPRFIANPDCQCSVCRKARGELPLGTSPFEPVKFPPAPVGHANWKSAAVDGCACLYCVVKRTARTRSSVLGA